MTQKELKAYRAGIEAAAKAVEDWLARYEYNPDNPHFIAYVRAVADRKQAL